MSSKIDKEVVSKIFELRSEGKLYSEIAEKIGYSIGTVARYLNNVELAEAPEYMLDTGKIIALYTAGWNVEQINREMTKGTEEQIKQIIFENDPSKMIYSNEVVLRDNTFLTMKIYNLYSEIKIVFNRSVYRKNNTAGGYIPIYNSTLVKGLEEHRLRTIKDCVFIRKYCLDGFNKGMDNIISKGLGAHRKYFYKSIFIMEEIK